MRDVVTREVELMGFVLAIGALLAAAEWANPYRPARRDLAETRRHLGWLGVYLLVTPATAWVVSRALRGLTNWSPLRTSIGAAPFALRAVIAVLVGELVAYWLHRWMHTVRWLWWLHSVHHRATEVRWWTAFRAHPLSGFVVHLLPFSAVAAAGVGSDAVALYVGVVIVVSVVAHADVFLPASPLDSLVVTPTFHRRHHERGGGRVHYSQVLPLMDVVFGTRRTSADDRQPDGQRGEVGAARRYGSDERIAIAVPHDRPLGDDHA